MRSGVCVKICKFQVIRAEDISSQDIRKDCLWASSQLAVHLHQDHWHHKQFTCEYFAEINWSASFTETLRNGCLPWLLRPVQDLCPQGFALFGTSHWKTCCIVSRHPAQNLYLFFLLFHYGWNSPLIQEQKQVWFHLQCVTEIEGESPPAKGWHCSCSHQ